MRLDEMTPLEARIGYGILGRSGDLGYERKHVVVQGKSYWSSLSTHPPARLLYRLDGRFGHFSCHVALNDDAPPGASHADFVVRVDGRQVAAVPFVVAGEPPRPLTAEIVGGQLLELSVTTTRWEFCHAVWLAPEMDELPADMIPEPLPDCLARAEILAPELPPMERCIATVVSSGYAALLDDMLGSLHANGGCHDVPVVVFTLGLDADCSRVIAKHAAIPIPCRARAPLNPMSKALLYSVARIIDAQQFLCLDADMLVLGDLRPLFHAITACPEGSILACREGNGTDGYRLGTAFSDIYGGHADDWNKLGITEREVNYTLVVNDGLFAAGRQALFALDGIIRAIPAAAGWIDKRRDMWWRNQFIFNLALARLHAGVEIDGAYNVQLHVQDAMLYQANGRMEAEWRGRKAKVLHFCGSGRRKYPDWRGFFAQVPDPLTGTGQGDGYGAFVSALRAWIGRHGLSVLAWSFYGTTDGRSARVSDADSFPLFALLHYILRANGCVRVMETGTARGVSAACMASAIAHQEKARVVTFDPHAYPESAELWESLPPAMSSCIETRQTGSLEGMAAALAAGERYDAALLDSMHTEEHVWAEFNLARQLVCPGGLILIHDVRYAHGTVEPALRRIGALGYGVVRLWTAEGGICQDDRLGLAVVENRRTPVGDETVVADDEARHCDSAAAVEEVAGQANDMIDDPSVSQDPAVGEGSDASGENGADQASRNNAG